MPRSMLFAAALVAIPVFAQPEKPVRLAIAGLVHGHVDGFILRPAQNRKDIQVVGVYEPDAELAASVAKKYNLPAAIFYTDLEKMLNEVKPDGVTTFTNTFDHAKIVEAGAPHRIPIMMEKPLAVSVEHARRIKRAADTYGIQVVVNYETSWYASHAAIWDLMKTRRAAGEIRRMVAMDGHQGPKEIGVGPYFLKFLTAPALNGAGALFDFGCYGANLMTWMMDNEKPLSVRALTTRAKPEIYANVDDDATILVEYPKAQGIIEASWNWPYSRKDFEVYAERGYAIATGGNSLRVRLGGKDKVDKEETATPPPMPADERDQLSYFAAVIRGTRRSAGLSSLENNMIATGILEAARESARTGKAVPVK